MTTIRYAHVLSLTVGAFLVSSVASANTLQVGTNKTYKKICDALQDAKQGDTVEVDKGTYLGDTCAVTTNGLTIRGVGGRAKLDVTGKPVANNKGIFDIVGENITIENIEFVGAQISIDNGENGAGIRMEGHSLVVRNCYFHDNQNGILATPLGTPGGTLLVEYSEFDHNALGNGCNDAPKADCTHNMYINHLDKFTLQYSYSHNVASDTPNKGHLVKSRAKQTFLLYNRLSGEDGLDSYEINLPNGGEGVILGNVIEQGKNTGNPILVSYGEEGLSNPDKRLFFINNTVINNLSKGTFLQLTSGTTLTAHNNIFAGPGTVSSTGTLSADNLSGIDPLFVNPNAFDYHLQTHSPALDKGVNPGSVDSFSLIPVDEYVHPLTKIMRKNDGNLDLGAFEYGTPLTGAGQGGTGGTNQTGSAGMAGSGQEGTAGMTGNNGGSGPTGTPGAGGNNNGSGQAGTTSLGGSDSGSGPTGTPGVGGGGAIDGVSGNGVSGGSGGALASDNAAPPDTGNSGCSCTLQGVNSMPRWFAFAVGLFLFVPFVRRRR